jgi:hypothetical protein
MAGDANCDLEITDADRPALAAALFGDNPCPGADANEDAVVSAADLPALLRFLDGAFTPTPTGSAGVTPTPTATPSPLLSPTPTPTLSACPAAGAEIRIAVEDRTGAMAMRATVRGRRLVETCVNADGLAETYEATVDAEPQSIAGLAPGVWVHSLTMDEPSTGQRQYRRSLVLANSAPDGVSFTAFASVFSVRVTTDAAESDSLRDALTWAESAPQPALIQFDEEAFPSEVPTTITLTSALPKLSGTAVTIDGLDAEGAAGNRVVDAAGLDIPALSISGASNTVIGLRLRHTGPRNRDVLSISGASATANLIEQCVIEDSGTGDAIGIDNNAGADFADTANVIRDCEVTRASDKGIKVTTNAYARVENNWVHDNENGGVQATLSGHVLAIDNLVERSGGGSAQNGLAANGGVSETSVVASELRTDGNISRFNAANGIAILGLSLGILQNDYLAANGSSGVRVFNRGIAAPLATIEGVTAACNGVDGAVVTDNAVADFGGPMSIGNNAFTQNNLPGGGANLRNGTGARVFALNNQWEHCGRETQCSDVDIPAYDLSDHGVRTLFSPAQAHRGERTPIITRTRPSKAAAGALVRIFGFRFNVIDGHAADATCPDVATRNRCVGLRGNCVLINGVPAPVEAVTPTMLVVRMPFTCVEPVPLTVQTQGGGTSTVMNFCTNE